MLANNAQGFKKINLNLANLLTQNTHNAFTKR